MTQPIDAKQIDAEYEEWLKNRHNSETLTFRKVWHAARSASAQEIRKLTERITQLEVEVRGEQAISGAALTALGRAESAKEAAERALESAACLAEGWDYSMLAAEIRALRGRQPL